MRVNGTRGYVSSKCSNGIRGYSGLDALMGFYALIWIGGTDRKEALTNLKALMQLEGLLELEVILEVNALMQLEALMDLKALMELESLME